MKNRIFSERLLAGFSAFSFSLCLSAFAAEIAPVPEQDKSPSRVASENSAVVTPGPGSLGSSRNEPKLPYGADDVAKLSRAKMNEDVILTYIQNSGTIYSLSPNDIVNLRNQGVSDRVINAMLDQKKRTAELAANAAATSQQAPYVGEQGGSFVQPLPDEQAAPVYLQSPPPVVQPAASTVYVIPYPARTYAYYGYSPYYSYYRGGYCAPTVSLGFGFGSGRHGHYRRCR